MSEVVEMCVCGWYSRLQGLMGEHVKSCPVFAARRDLAEALELLCSINDYEGDIPRKEFSDRLLALLARHPKGKEP